MPALTWNTLTGSKGIEGSIRSWINYDRIPADQIVAMAEDWIWREVRSDVNLLSATGTIALGAQSIARPARFKNPAHMEITGTERGALRLVPIRDLRQATGYGADGLVLQDRPLCYAVTASALELNARSDKAYPYRIDYYGALAPLAEANPTNWLTDDAADLLIAATKFYGYRCKGDETAATAEAEIAAALIQRVNREADMARYGGATIAMMPG